MKKYLFLLCLFWTTIINAQTNLISVSDILRLYNGRNYKSAVLTLEKKGFKYGGYDNLRGGAAQYTWTKNCDVESGALSITRMGANNSGIIVTCDVDNYKGVMTVIREEIYNQTNLNTIKKQITGLGYKKGYTGGNGQFYVKNENSPVLLLVSGDRFGHKYTMLNVWSYAGYMAQYGEKKESNAEAVDLGLSVLWSDRNMGATGIANYGRLYTSPFDYWQAGQAEYSGNKDDRARKEWGDKWRIPSKAEFVELSNSCKKVPVTLSNGVVGVKFIGPNGNSIVLPLSGMEEPEENIKKRAGETGCYWTSTFDNYMSVFSVFPGGNTLTEFSPTTKNLLSIRPVKNKNSTSSSVKSSNQVVSAANTKDELLENANKGDKNAQYALALNYISGINGYEENEQKGLEWMLKAAQQNHINAQSLVGYCYHFGIGTSKDYKKAVYWYTKAANAGDAKAQCNLGKCYIAGEGVTPNKQQGINWYKKAARNGSSVARQNLAELGIYNY